MIICLEFVRIFTIMQNIIYHYIISAITLFDLLLNEDEDVLKKKKPCNPFEHIIE